MPEIFRDMTEPELRDMGTRIGRAVRAEMPWGGLFVTLYFDDSLIGKYVSNANRKDMIKVLLETADRLLSNEDVPR
jgi:hypothetical protein